jgi:DNA-binding NarL/FixJ family response regulator
MRKAQFGVVFRVNTRRSFMGTAEQFTVLVAHEDPIVSMGLVAALSQQADFKVTAVDRDIADLDAMVRQHCPDVVVADYQRGLACLRKGAERQRPRDDSEKVVIVTSRDRELEIRSALQLGIRGYVLLGTSLAEFVEGVRAVARGAHFLSRSVAPRIASSLAHNALTKRESDVLQLLVEGHVNKQIATELGIANETVKCHVKAILEKLEASTRTHAAAIAMKRGLVHARQSWPSLRHPAGDISMSAA